MILSGPPSNYGYHKYQAPPWLRSITGFQVNPEAMARTNIAMKEPEVGRIIAGLLPKKGVVPGVVPQRPNTVPKSLVRYRPGVSGLKKRSAKVF